MFHLDILKVRKTKNGLGRICTKKRGTLTTVRVDGASGREVCVDLFREKETRTLGGDSRKLGVRVTVQTTNYVGRTGQYPKKELRLRLRRT